MQDDDFSKILNNRIEELSKTKAEITKNLLTGNWHAVQVEQAINTALDQLESMSENEETDVTKELLSLLGQTPGLVLSIWNNAVSTADAIEVEISRWQEMGRYYSQFLENKKKEEDSKKKEEDSKKKEEFSKASLKDAIASGEIEEPTKMAAIRRKKGSRPGMSLAQYRKLAAEINNEEETDVDDSRG